MQVDGISPGLFLHLFNYRKAICPVNRNIDFLVANLAALNDEHGALAYLAQQKGRVKCIELDAIRLVPVDPSLQHQGYSVELQLSRDEAAHFIVDFKGASLEVVGLEIFTE